MKYEALSIAASLAKPFESLRLRAYWDAHPDGLPTQGYGRLMSRYSLKRHLQEGKTLAQANQWLQATYPPITVLTAEHWLEEDIEKAYNGTLKYVTVKLSANQAAAITDFSFNCGVGNFQISTLRRLINRAAFLDAANEFPKWNKSGGIVLKGLIRRRLAEKELWLSE
jgi:lysozyme